MVDVNNGEYKACFCDGSCRISGVCGGDRVLEEREPLIADPEKLREAVGETKADKMRILTNQAQFKEREEDRNTAKQIYEESLTEIEVEARKGIGKACIFLSEGNYPVLTINSSLWREVVEIYESNGFSVSYKSDLRNSISSIDSFIVSW